MRVVDPRRGGVVGSDPQFDPIAPDYEAAIDRSIAFSGRDHGFFTGLKAERILELARRAGDPARLSFLDVGCGIGATDEHLVGRVGELHGVDISPAMVARAAERNPGASYVVGDGRTLPFEDGRFDVSFAVCVLHHVEPPERASFLAEAARVTRPGGVVLVLEHNPHNPLTRRAVASCPFDDDVHLPRRSETVRLAREIGLHVVEQRYIVFFPWRGRLFDVAERALAFVPFGAQYVVAATT